MLTAEDLPTLEDHLAQIETLISEGERHIKEQVRVVESARATGEPSPEAEHTLHVMIELQVSHLMHRDRLLEERKRTLH